MPLTPGQVFAADFELLRPLGEGGMGEVWLARDRPLGRDVALKIMRASDGPARSARFAREARALAALDHPSILPILRFGEDPATRRPFLVTRAVLLTPEEKRRLCREILRCPLPREEISHAESAEFEFHAESAESAEFESHAESAEFSRRGAPARPPGPVTLADLLEGGRALPQAAVLRLARDLAGALGAAHASGILHRDVKPSNILYDVGGRALLADFGLAKFTRGVEKTHAESAECAESPDGRDPSRPEMVPGAAEAPGTISLDGEGRAKFLGSPAYAAPEQFDPAAGPLSAALDWYSFGAVLYRALTGHRPGSPRRPSSFDPRHVSRAWDPFLAALLEPDPGRRLSATADVLRALDRIGRAVRTSPIVALARFWGLCFAIGTAIALAVMHFRHADPPPVESHAEGAEVASHAESAEDAEVASHAEGAEGTEVASHAESAEGAEVASHAESAEGTEVASHAESAEGAEVASHAETAEGAEVASHAESAEGAEVASHAEGAEFSGWVSAQSALGTPPQAALNLPSDPEWAAISTATVYGGVPRVVARLEGRHVFISRPLRFDGPANVEIVGPGRLDAEIVGTPKARVAILGGAAVIDTTEDRDPLHSPRFRLGAGAFLALPKVLRIFPDDFAEPYGEPDPENPKPGDRALRFSTPARSLADQMQLERVQLADAAVVAEGDELVAAPELGRELGWTNGVVWRTSAAHPWVVDAPGDGAVVGSIAGGVGESVLEMEIEDGEPCVVSVEGYWPGKADHGGRGAVFEVLSGDVVVFSDSSDRRPTDGWKPMNMSFYPGRHRITFRLRSDLWSPPGHLFAVRIKRMPE